MNIKLFFFSIILLIYSNLSAQFSLGINLEPFSLSSNAGTNEGLSPLSLSASLDYQLDSVKSFSFRAGLYGKDIGTGIFRGSNFSLYGRYHFNGTLYLLTCLGLHKNDGSGSMASSVTNRKVFLVGVGVGVKLIKSLHIENLLLLPVGNSEFATISFFGSNSSLSMKINYLYKLSFGIEFEL
ncbi:MAG: hypothetical protein FIA82_00385 [Melioribacter sp.]|nr:hypothetical protein [Melioribacter sp.]